MAKIGIILSGCGVKDGSEIHEAVLAMLYVAKNGGSYVCLAPDVEQAHVINHATGEVEEGETRNVLVEAARIARGDIRDVADIKAEELDGLILPGGFGAAKNISDMAFHTDPTEAAVEIHTAQLIEAMHKAGKPIGFICVAPASVGAVALKGEGVTLTIGSDAAFAAGIEALGNKHVTAGVEDIVVDETHNVISTPAYMLAGNIAELEAGIAKLVAEVVKRAAA